MATNFEISLENFARWATSVDPKFGDQVRDIIGTQYVSQLAGFGAAEDVATAPNRTVAKLSDLVASVSGTYLKTAEAYYNAKARIAELKVAAKGSPLTQFYNAATPVPASWILWAGAALVGVVLLSRSGGRR